MNFYDFINSYDVCAVNGLSHDEAAMLKELYPQAFKGHRIWPNRTEINMRFVRGLFASHYNLKYVVGDHFNGLALEAVLNSHEIDELFGTVEDIQIDVSDII